jgi:hypothetical protein
MKNCIQCTLEKLEHQKNIISQLSLLSVVAKEGDSALVAEKISELESLYTYIENTIIKYSNSSDGKAEHCAKCRRRYIEELEIYADSLDSIQPSSPDTVQQITNFKTSARENIEALKNKYAP